MNAKILRLKKLVGPILNACATGRVSVRGDAWAAPAGAKRSAGPPLSAAAGVALTPANCLAFVDRCLFEILWEHNLEKLKKGRGAVPPEKWLAERFRYRGKIYQGMKPRGGGDRFLDWLLRDASADRLVLLLTHSCQLRCSYCTVAKYPAEISFPVIKKACDLLLASGRTKLWIQFFGGEPLLRFESLKRAAEYFVLRASRAGKTAGLGVTTNGLGLDSEKLDFIEKNGINLEVSCDGDEKAHSADRPPLSGNSRGTYKKLISNLDSVRKRDIRYKVIMVVTPESLGRMRRNYECLAAAGHRSIQVNYALGTLWREEAAAEFLAELGAINMRNSRRPGSELVNYGAIRREPVALNSELSCDCDGTLYRETGLCLERDFTAMKERFRVGSVFDGRLDARLLGNTQFDNFYILTTAYARSEKSMELVMNNVGLGRKMAELQAL